MSWQHLSSRNPKMKSVYENFHKCYDVTSLSLTLRKLMLMWCTSIPDVMWNRVKRPRQKNLTLVSQFSWTWASFRFFPDLFRFSWTGQEKSWIVPERFLNETWWFFWTVQVFLNRSGKKLNRSGFSEQFRFSWIGQEKSWRVQTFFMKDN